MMNSATGGRGSSTTWSMGRRSDSCKAAAIALPVWTVVVARTGAVGEVVIDVVVPGAAVPGAAVTGAAAPGAAVVGAVVPGGALVTGATPG